jgi:hypothetical protein
VSVNRTDVPPSDDISVASSDATNLKNATARIEGDQLVLSGHKWVSLYFAGSCRSSLTYTVDIRCRRPSERHPHSPLHHRPLPLIAT